MGKAGGDKGLGGGYLLMYAGKHTGKCIRVMEILNLMDEVGAIVSPQKLFLWNKMILTART